MSVLIMCFYGHRERILGHYMQVRHVREMTWADCSVGQSAANDDNGF